MLRHPDTGKPIIQLKQTNNLSKTIRKLVWCNTNEELNDAHRISAAIATSNITIYESACTAKIPIYAFYSIEPSIDINKIVELKQNPLLFIVSRFKITNDVSHLLSSCGNILILEDIQSHLPFLLHHTFDLESIGDIHTMIGLVNRSTHIITSETITPDAIKALEEYNVTVHHRIERKEVWLVTQYFRPSSGRRAKEIDACLQENLTSGVFDRIILFNETEAPLSSRIMATVNSVSYKCKLDIRDKKQRITYGDYLSISNELDNDNDVYLVAANADITFDKDRWRDIHCVSMNNVAFSILRHDIPEYSQVLEGVQPKLYGFPGPSEDSTDAWVVSSKFINNIISKRDVIERFNKLPFGFAGCDQAFVGELIRNKLTVYNPALHFKIYHHQTSGINTATRIIPDCQVFGKLRVCGLLDIIFDTDKIKATQKCVFERPHINLNLSGDNMKSVETFCTMVERHERYIWKHNQTNIIKFQHVPIYEWNNCIISPYGQVQLYDRHIVGQTNESLKICESNGVGSLQITTHADTMWGIPIRSQVPQSIGRYFTEYFSKALQLMKQFPDVNAPLLLLNNAKDWVSYFQWPNLKEQIPALYWNNKTVFHCDTVIGTIDGPWFSEVSSTDIDILRSSFRPYNPNKDESKVVIVLGGAINDVWASQLQELFNNKQYNSIIIDPTTATVEQIINAFSGAAQVIVSGGGPESGKAAVDYSPRTFWSWMLPQSSRILEIQNEFNPDGEVAAICAASNVTHMFLIIHRAPSDVQLKNIYNRLNSLFSNYNTAPIIDSSSDITTLKFSL